MLMMMSEDKINLELLGARVATVNDRLHDLELRMRSLEIEMPEMKGHFGALEARFTRLEERFTAFEQRYSIQEERMSRMLAIPGPAGGAPIACPRLEQGRAAGGPPTMRLY
jgi:hypothetical protein